MHASIRKSKIYFEIMLIGFESSLLTIVQREKKKADSFPAATERAAATVERGCHCYFFVDFTHAVDDRDSREGPDREEGCL